MPLIELDGLPGVVRVVKWVPNNKDYLVGRRFFREHLAGQEAGRLVLLAVKKNRFRVDEARRGRDRNIDNLLTRVEFCRVEVEKALQNVQSAVGGVFWERRPERFNISQELNLRFDFTVQNAALVIVVLILVVVNALVNCEPVNLLQIGNILLEYHIRNQKQVQTVRAQAILECARFFLV